MKLTTHLHLVLRSSKVELYLHSPYVFLEWYLAKHRFYFTLLKLIKLGVTLFPSLVEGFNVATCLGVWKVIQKMYVGRLNASEMGGGSVIILDPWKRGVSDMLFHMLPYMHFNRDIEYECS
jgi:hypothetical protein